MKKFAILLLFLCGCSCSYQVKIQSRPSGSVEKIEDGNIIEIDEQLEGIKSP